MNETLDLLIDKFRAAQDIGVETLKSELQIPQPESNRGWVYYCAAHRQHIRGELQRVEGYVHGYGVSLKVNFVEIDFDWGENGEPDGFDGWRLYRFSRNNMANVSCTHEMIDDWLDAAYANCELIKIGSLYYDPTRRAPNRRD